MDITTLLLEMATVRGNDKTICPSEAARKQWPGEWKKHMEEVRKAAFHLRDEGKVQITQKGKEVAGNEPTGPIRIKIV